MRSLSLQMTNILGFDAITSYDHQSSNEKLALYFAGIMLLAQTFYHFAAGPGGPLKVSTLRALIINYNLSVALFAIIRALMDTGKPLLLGAAFHNAMVRRNISKLTALVGMGYCQSHFIQAW